MKLESLNLGPKFPYLGPKFPYLGIFKLAFEKNCFHI